MRDEVEAALPGSATRTRRGTPGLDLRAGLRAQLAALGVARVGVDPRCTVEDPDLYSYRRDAPHRPPRRRHLARPVPLASAPVAAPGPALVGAPSTRESVRSGPRM